MYGLVHSIISDPNTPDYGGAEYQAIVTVYAKDNKRLFNHVMDLLGAGSAIKDIVSAVLKKFNVKISERTVLFYATIEFYDIIDSIDRYMFNSARAKYNKICIQQLNLRGNISNVYLEWAGNYVSADPFENWNPTFRAGDYTVY